MSYAIVAEFEARPEAAEAFAALACRHAAQSRTEPGCRRFEISRDADASRQFLFYEVYDDANAYARHRETAHYAHFREVAPAMLVAGEAGIFHRRSVLTRLSPDIHDEPQQERMTP